MSETILDREPGRGSFELEADELEPDSTASAQKANGSKANGYKAGGSKMKAAKSKPKPSKAKLNGDRVAASSSSLWEQVAVEVERDGAGPTGGADQDRARTPIGDSTTSTVMLLTREPETDSAAVAVEAGEAVSSDDSDDSALSIDTQPEAGSRRSFLVKHYVTFLVGFVAVGLTVALVLTTMALSNKNSLESARSSAIVAAKTYSMEIAGYNYQHLNQDFAAVVANSTPAFQRSFSQAGDALKATLERYHATASPSIVAAGIVSATTSSADVLIFLDQKIANSIQKNSTTDRVQVEISLVRVRGKWLINNVTLL